MMSDSLPTVQELDKHLKKLVAWKRFAVHLPGMDMSMIDAIAMSNCGGYAEQKLATYDTWLRICPDPSWEHVIKALETIDENRLAKELKEKLYINSRNSAEQHKSSCPGQPFIEIGSRSSVKLCWEKPRVNSAYVTKYVVCYCTADTIDTWVDYGKSTTAESIDVQGLNPNETYIFKVKAFDHSGNEFESKSSKSVKLVKVLLEPPGKPTVKAVSESSITLEWTPPKDVRKKVKIYTVSYSLLNNEEWNVLETSKTIATIANLVPNTCYLIKVQAKWESEESQVSEISIVQTNNAVPDPPGKPQCKSAGSDCIELFWKLLPHCTKIDETNIPTFLLPKESVYVDDQHMFNKYDIKFAPINTRISQKTHELQCPSKVLLLVGATGSGKTTLINQIVNYIMRVEFGDHFRYKLVHETSIQTESVTKWITAYTIHHEPGFQLPFSLTIVDTPGFGDTEGIARDKIITEQVKHFFSTKEGIDHLDGIGFVCQAGFVHLTPTQRYIFDSVFAMFGNDIKDNMFVLCTFCDGEEPAVIKVMEEANIPVNRSFFKFNNSALDASNRNPIGEFFWNIGIASFREFFQKFERASSVSLRLTKEVLQQRENLETIVTGVQKLITAGMNIIDQSKREIDILETERAKVEENKGFEYEVEETVLVKVNLANKECTTNCLKCNMTCHYPCPYSNDEQKKCCIAMDNPGRDDACCAVCPSKCHWSDHRNQPFRLETETRLVRKEYTEMKRKYEIAVHKKLSIKNVVDSQCDSYFEVVFNLIQKANICTKRLDEIAFCPNHLTEVEYIQLLIDAQLQEKKKGYQERIKYYQILQEKAETLAQIKEIGAKAVQGDKRWWEQFFMA